MAPFARSPYSANSVVPLDSYLLNEKINDSSKTYPPVNEIVSSVEYMHEDDESILFVQTSEFISRTKFKIYLDRNWVLKESEEFAFPGGVVDDNVFSSDMNKKVFVNKLQAALAEPRVTEKMEVFYDGEHEGIPLLSKVVYTKIDDRGSLISKTIYTITKIVPGPPAMEVFDPKQFVSNVDDRIGISSISPWRVVLIDLGLALIILAVCNYCYARKKI